MAELAAVVPVAVKFVADVVDGGVDNANETDGSAATVNQSAATGPRSVEYDG
jgi:hypothetical protein